MSNINDLTVAQLRRAVEIREEIESLQGQLQSLIGGGSNAAAPTAARRGRKPGRRAKAAARAAGTRTPGKRRMSAAGRARIAAAARERWAKFRSGSASEAPARAPKKRFNAAARAKLSAAAKARWAKAKADGKSGL
ncbi:MAG TPA: hypothetical protein VFC44_17805 [Candidatus Saccharimonadales bacterium]|nr:hypothetical protein [Candidatus Saccharimonadales bacterium]